MNDATTKRAILYLRLRTPLVTPRDRSGDLPPLIASAPSSPSEVLALAVIYAAEHQSNGPERLLVKAAWRALMEAFPDLARQDLAARVAGVQILRDHLAQLQA